MQARYPDLGSSDAALKAYSTIEFLHDFVIDFGPGMVNSRPPVARTTSNDVESGPTEPMLAKATTMPAGPPFSQDSSDDDAIPLDPRPASKKLTAKTL